MEYQEIIEYVSTLDFADEPQVADAMTKAVLGILFSTVDEPVARHLAEHLPEPLTVESLRGHQLRKNQPTFEGYVQEIRQQFGLSDDEGFELIDAVVRVTREAAGQFAWDRFVEQLPAELGEGIRKP